MYESFIGRIKCDKYDLLKCMQTVNASPVRLLAITLSIVLCVDERSGICELLKKNIIMIVANICTCKKQL